MRRRFLIRLAVAALGTALMTACRGTLPTAPPAPLTEAQARYLESRQRMLQRFAESGAPALPAGVEAHALLARARAVLDRAA